MAAATEHPCRAALPLLLGSRIDYALTAPWLARPTFSTEREVLRFEIVEAWRIFCVFDIS